LPALAYAERLFRERSPKDLIDRKSVPPLFRRACGIASVVQRGRNAIRGHASGPEFLHAGNNHLFAFVRTIGFPAFAAACSRLHALARATELEQDVGLFAL
jgi:hypothetical protein